ncbi:MAG TPA: hypothetical protein VF306_22500 [Pirellulales bacterium]
MDDHQEIPPDLLIALDACRADSPDRELPEVAEALARHPAALVDRVRRRLERTDRAIAAALPRVPVPEGLAGRILANLAHRSPVGDCTPAGGAAVGVAERSRHGSFVRLRRAPRLRLAVGTAAAVAAVALLAVSVRPAREIDMATVEQLARDFYATDEHDAELSTTASPSDFPLDGRLASSHVNGWRRVAGGFLNRPAVAYEMSSRGGAVPATLYVINSRSLRVAGAGASPRAPASTGGITIGVWQDNEHVYVLVVRGEVRDFQSFFPPSRGVA